VSFCVSSVLVSTLEMLISTPYFISGKPADLYNKTHPDWAPTLKLSDEIKAHKSHQVKQKPDSQLSR
jgi:hypothetical protein